MLKFLSIFSQYIPQKKRSAIKKIIKTIDQKISKFIPFKKFYAMENDVACLKTQAQRLLLTQKRHSAYRIRVVFLVHVAEFWYALKPIYDRMLIDSHIYEPLIVCIPGSLTGKNYHNSAHAYFTRQHIPVIHVANTTDINPALLDILNPDIIFKQVPWESQYPDAFKTINQIGHRICYIPYGIHTNPVDHVLYNNIIHQYSWRLYCVNDYHRQLYATYNPIGDANAVVSGYTKFEYIARELKKEPMAHWPIKNNTQPTLKILWSPHHSLNDWLGFCTFFDNYKDILTFAQTNPSIHIVFRPHPALFELLVIRNKLSQKEIDFFIREFSQLDNCHLDNESDYIYLFQHSDVLVTDGIGFLFEYLLTGKPIIHIDNKANLGFNEYYKQVEPAWYKASTVQDVDALLKKLQQGDDPLMEKRKDLVKWLYPIAEKEPSQIICDDIYLSILGQAYVRH